MLKVLIIILLIVIGVLIYFVAVENPFQTCPGCPECPAPINCSPNLLTGQVKAHRKFQIFINDDTEPAFEHELTGEPVGNPPKIPPEIVDFSVELPSKEELKKIRFTGSPFSFPDMNLYAYGQSLLPLKPGSYDINLFINKHSAYSIRAGALHHPDTNRVLSYDKEAEDGHKAAFKKIVSGNIYHGGRTLTIYFD